MVRLVSGGAEAFDALAFQERHPSTVNFLMNQFASVSSTITDATRAFFDRAKFAITDTLGTEALERARALSRSVQMSFQRDDIRVLYTLEDLQNATMKAQRFIMAEPSLRKAYHEQRVDGYSGLYVDMHPSDIGWHHYDYRLATDGLALPVTKQDIAESLEGDLDEDCYRIECFMDDPVEGDRHLDIEEQDDIQSNWNLIQYLVREREKDLTSVTNEDMG